MEAISTTERRRSVRRPFKVPAKILLHQHPVALVSTVEISLGGIGIVSETPIDASSACAIAFELQTPHARRRVNIWGTVAHTVKLRDDMYRSGIAMLDADSGSRQFLRQFIEELALLERDGLAAALPGNDSAA